MHRILCLPTAVPVNFRGGRWMMTRSSVGAVVVLAMLVGCKGSSKEPTAQAPREPSADSTATESPSAPLAATTPCAFWKGAKSLVVHAGSGRGDDFREFRYDFVSGKVEVNDSDAFATGKEAEVPRVTKKSKILSADEKVRVEKGMVALCPTAEDMKRRCAPGGCAYLEVQGSVGTSTVEDSDAVWGVMKLLQPLFTEIRQQ